jgi:hypothetical protein
VKIRLLIVVVAALVASGVAVLASPASAGESATLTVIKTVEGPVPDDAEFVINVLCVYEEINGTIVVPAGIDVVYDEDITFGPEGGEEEFEFFDPAVCTITETDDGGAEEVINREIEVAIEEPTLYDAEITNIFADVVTTTTATTAAPTTTAAAAAATATPRFTG